MMSSSIWSFDRAESALGSAHAPKHATLDFPHFQHTDMLFSTLQTRSPASSISELEEDDMMNLIPNLWSEEPRSSEPVYTYTPQQSRHSSTSSWNQPLTEENLRSISKPAASSDTPTAATTHTHSSGSVKSATLNTSLYKTELCLQFESKGSCPYGAKCQFAHGKEELKRVQRSSNWKTKPCVNWTNSGWCKYGRRCCFKHGEDDC